MEIANEEAPQKDSVFKIGRAQQDLRIETGMQMRLHVTILYNII